LSSRLPSKNIKIKINEKMLPAVLYGCEIWSLTLKKKHSLRVFQNRLLRRIFVSKGDEIKGGWRKLHNEELHNLYSLPDIIRIIKSKRIRWTGHVARMGSKSNAYMALMGKPEGRDH
jgi:hypothetical protein